MVWLVSTFLWDASFMGAQRLMVLAVHGRCLLCIRNIQRSVTKTGHMTGKFMMVIFLFAFANFKRQSMFMYAEIMTGLGLMGGKRL